MMLTTKNKKRPDEIEILTEIVGNEKQATGQTNLCLGKRKSRISQFMCDIHKESVIRTKHTRLLVTSKMAPKLRQNQRFPTTYFHLQIIFCSSH